LGSAASRQIRDKFKYGQIGCGRKLWRTLAALF